MATGNPDLNPIDLAVAINAMHGQAIEGNHVINQTVNTIRNSLDMLSGKSQGTVTRTINELRSKLSKRNGNVQSVIDGTVNDLSGNILSTIESAAIPLVELGVELPTATDISLAKSALVSNPNLQPTGSSAPATLTGTAGTGALSPLATGGGGGGGSGSWPYTCLVHLLPVSEQTYYRTLVQTATGEYTCSAYPLFPQGPAPTVIRSFPNWWNAELACRLISECGWTIQQMIPYWRAIDSVVLGINSLAKTLGPFCSTAQAIFDAYMLALLGTGTVGGSPVGTSGSGGTTGSGGFGGIDTCPAGYHLVNGQCVPN